MAVGDKVYLADKQTLDEVNGKVGATNNTGGTATAGTLFGKLNAIISSIATHVANWTAARAANLDTTVSSRQSEADAASRYNALSSSIAAFVANWTAAKAANLDAAVSSRQSEANAVSRYNTLNTNTGVNNTASATGTLSQKLSHIINLFTNNRQKHLASKVVNFTVATAGTHTILNITGSGVFEFAYTSMGGSTGALTFEVDGQSQTFNIEVGSKYVAKSIYNPGALLYMVPSSSSAATNFPAMRPLYFKNSLKITVVKSDTAEQFFRGNYSVYE